LIAFVIILANHSENYNETRPITWDGIRQNAVDYLIGLGFAKISWTNKFSLDSPKIS
jgi:hypothetical protein